MKKISILGSTGSIGTQSLDVIRKNIDKFKVVGLTANSNIDLLEKQIKEFKPEAVAVADEPNAVKLKKRLNGDRTDIYFGMEGLCTIASLSDADTVLTSVVGMVGLLPTLEAIKYNKEIALANKETLVAGGGIIKKALTKSSSAIIPVDSEHCAIFQCLQCSNKREELRKIILTASGGPFRGKSLEELRFVTPEEALKHPKWNMGRKISIDSATLMNKGLEVIEAHWLFNVSFNNIDVIIHPQSIIHSMVEYKDGSIIAQLGITDMRNPILYALGYPDRLDSSLESLNLLKHGSLCFEAPDMETFKCLKLSYEAGKEGGTMPVVLNSANEAAVSLYLDNKVSFLDISCIIEKAMMNHINISNPSLEEILETDRITRKTIYNQYRGDTV